jgi:hypothetical protein
MRKSGSAPKLIRENGNKTQDFKWSILDALVELSVQEGIAKIFESVSEAVSDALPNIFDA